MTSTIDSPLETKVYNSAKHVLPKGLIDKHLRLLETLTCVTEKCDELNRTTVDRCKLAADEREAEVRKELEMRLESLNKEKKDLEVKVEDLRKTLEELNSSGESSIAAKDAELASLRADRDKWCEQANTFERRYQVELQRTQAMLESLKTRLHLEHEEKVDALNKTISELRLAHQADVESLDRFKKRFEKDQQLQDQLEEEVNLLKETNSQLQRRIDDLSNSLKHANETLEIVKSTARFDDDNRPCTECEALKKDLQISQHKNTELQNTIESLRKDLAKSQDLVQKLQKQSTPPSSGGRAAQFKAFVDLKQEKLQLEKELRMLKKRLKGKR
eukprot:g1469.t1